MDKIKVKGATQVSGHFLNYIFVCLKDHRGSIIVYIIIIFLEYFTLITKFTCSKLNTNQKKNCMFKTFKPWKWIVFIFLKRLTKCAPFHLKIEKDFNIDD
jgi:hypothetical protein